MVDSELVNVLTSLMDSFKEEIKSEIKTINTRLDSLAERVTNLEKTCAIIQEEHGKKLDLILDYIAGDIERNEQISQHFSHIDRTLADHSVRLAVIESTHVYQSALKNNNLDSKAAL